MSHRRSRVKLSAQAKLLPETISVLHIIDLPSLEVIVLALLHLRDLVVQHDEVSPADVEPG